jgi:hypothetical protein
MPIFYKYKLFTIIGQTVSSIIPGQTDPTGSRFETFEKCPILPAQLNSYLIFNRVSRPRTILQDIRIGQLSSCP